jgi:6-phosphogluconolactonase
MPSSNQLRRCFAPAPAPSSVPGASKSSALLAFLVFVALTASGCAGQHTATGAEILYVNAAGAIQSFTIDKSTGSLKPLGSVAFPGSPAYSVTNGRLLYVSDELQDVIYGYSIDPRTGTLTAISGSPFGSPFGSGCNGSPSGGCQLAIDPQGRYLAIAGPVTNLGKQIGTFLINQNTGALTPTSAAAPVDNSSPVQVVFDPSGRFVYASDLGSLAGSGIQVSAFSIDSTTAALTPLVGSPFTFPTGENPRGLIVDSSGTRLYAPLQSGGVAGLSLDPSTGALTGITGSPFPDPGGLGLGTVALQPSGKFLYSTAVLNGIAYGYQINPSTGALTAFSSLGFPGPLALAIVVDPSGQFLFVYSEQDGFEIQPYAIDSSTGALTAMSPVQLGFNSGALTLGFTGVFLTVELQ